MKARDAVKYIPLVILTFPFFALAFGVVWLAGFLGADSHTPTEEENDRK